MTDDQRKIFEDDLLRRFFRDDDFPIIDGFQILARVGSGGMGIVFHAINSRTGQECAIKVLSTVSESAYARFAAESKTHQLLGDHPNIVSFFGVGLCQYLGREDVPYIECQFIEGGNLRSEMEGRRQRGATNDKDILRILKQVCNALSHAHSIEVTHRDVKPENILISNSSNVYLADFGIATRDKLGRFTQFGRGAGTDSYIAPEVLIGRTPQPSADVYSCGILLYELITGSLPDRDMSAIENPPPEISRWSRVLQKSTEIDPRNRYLTIAQFINSAMECAQTVEAKSRRTPAVDGDSVINSDLVRHAKLSASVELLLRSRIQTKARPLLARRRFVDFSYLENDQIIAFESDGGIQRYDCSDGGLTEGRIQTNIILENKHRHRHRHKFTTNGGVALSEAQGKNPKLVRLSDGVIVQELDVAFALIDESWLVEVRHDSGKTYLKAFDLNEIDTKVSNWSLIQYSDLVETPVLLRKPAVMKQGRIAVAESQSNSVWLIDIESGTSRRETFSRYNDVTPLALTRDASHLAISCKGSVYIVNFKTGLIVTEQSINGYVASPDDLHFNHNATLVAAQITSDEGHLFCCWRVSDGMVLFEFPSSKAFRFRWSPDRDWIACQLEDQIIEILQLRHSGSKHASDSGNAANHFRTKSVATDVPHKKLSDRIQRAGYFTLRHLNNSIEIATVLMFVLLVLGFLSLSSDNDDSASISCFIFALILRIWTAFIPTVVDWGDSWVNSLSDSSRTKRPLQ